MTRERDRIQENANKYIVKNCPCYTSKGDYYDCWANQDTWCENITDCVIKQVIEKCKYAIDHLHKMQKALASLEEIRKINNKWLKRWINDSDEIAGFEEIENKINEVL